MMEMRSLELQLKKGHALNEWETLKEVLEGIKNGVEEYNQDHLHSALNYLSPNEFDEKIERENTLNNAA